MTSACRRTQEYQGRNPVALAAVTEGSRNVGEIYGIGRWTINPRLTFECDGRYAHTTICGSRPPEPARGDHRGAASRASRARKRRPAATGLEAPRVPIATRRGRGFGARSPRSSGPAAPTYFEPSARSFDVDVEREFEGTNIFGVRRIYQSVDDHLVTLFGLNIPQEADLRRPYYVASAGAVDADGWAVQVGSLSTGRVRGSLEYSRTTAHWLSRGGHGCHRSLVAQRGARDVNDELHDITTSIETDIQETSTRVFVLYIS